MTGTGRHHDGADDLDSTAVAALCERLVPADDWPGLDPTVFLDHVTSVGAHALDAVRRFVVAGGDEERLDPADRSMLRDLAAEAFYGSADSVGARMVGFDRGRVEPVEACRRPVQTTEFGAVAQRYDVVVVGAGAGGGVAAAVCAAAGASVLVVERGRSYDHEDLSRDHLRNHRSPVRGVDTGPPPGTPRVCDGDVVVDPASPTWHNNAVAVGGGTRVFGAVGWRFVPEDFTMASRHGVPDGSSLADWPLRYDDLEEHYAWVEDTVGVAGDADAHRRAGPRSGRYPMPPLSGSRESEVLAAAARRLGIDVGAVPVMINTVERAGRGACVRCGECAGFSCGPNARAGTHNTVVVDALATGNATVTPGVRATRVTVDAHGRVDGVELRDESTGARRRVTAGHVVVAAGAIETARLLLASRSAAHPDGLGNATDQVGRHLQGHGFVSAFGLFDEAVRDTRGPGVEIGTLDVTHGLRDDHGEVIGGGVITNELVKQPIVHWRWALPPDAPRDGADAKAAMRAGFGHTAHLFGHVQEIPTPQNRVRLASVVDDAGEPVAEISGRAHRETIRTGAAVLRVAQEWMAETGAARVWTEAMATGLLAGHHQAGTCRMGDDPASSVTDPTGRVHGHDNLWVADASLHVTNGSVNPSLTIMALARRVAGTLLAHG